MSRKVYGWGINDADYAVKPRVRGKQVPCVYYETWRHMVERCHNPKYQKIRPTYKGCKIAAEWKYFSNFKAWMEKQNWKGMQLDKDILGNGKLYSSRTCCFVENWLNSLFNDRKGERGEQPLGVTRHREKFRAKINIRGKRVHLGLFDTPQEAHQTYCRAKIKYVKELIFNYPDKQIKLAALEKSRVLYSV